MNNKSSTFENHPPVFISKEKKTLDSIKKKVKIENLINTKADNGNCVVILEKSLYIEKVQNFQADWTLKC